MMNPNKISGTSNGSDFDSLTEMPDFDEKVQEEFSDREPVEMGRFVKFKDEETTATGGEKPENTIRKAETDSKRRKKSRNTLVIWNFLNEKATNLGQVSDRLVRVQDLIALAYASRSAGVISKVEFEAKLKRLNDANKAVVKEADAMLDALE